MLLRLLLLGLVLVPAPLLLAVAVAAMVLRMVTLSMKSMMSLLILIEKTCHVYCKDAKWSCRSSMDAVMLAAGSQDSRVALLALALLFGCTDKEVHTVDTIVPERVQLVQTRKSGDIDCQSGYIRPPVLL